MTSSEFMKYVGYGFFAGTVLFLVAANTLSASEDNISRYCYVSSENEMVLCGKYENVESIDTYCLPVATGQGMGTLFVCTDDQVVFTTAFEMRNKSIEDGNYYHHEGEGEKTPHTPSHDF